MDKLDGAKKCCIMTNIGAGTYYIAGIRWELQGHPSWTLAEVYGWISAFILSWQPFIWLYLCHYQNSWNLLFYVLTISIYISGYLQCFVVIILRIWILEIKNWCGMVVHVHFFVINLLQLSYLGVLMCCFSQISIHLIDIRHNWSLNVSIKCFF